MPLPNSEKRKPIRVFQVLLRRHMAENTHHRREVVVRAIEQEQTIRGSIKREPVAAKRELLFLMN